MPLITASHDSLPYIDPALPPTGSYSLAHAAALIDAELPASSSTLPSHPALPPLQSSKFTEIGEKEQERVKNGIPLDAIDLLRYEAPSSLSSSDNSDENPKDQERKRMHEAYVVSEYLRQRLQNLSLLDEFGKNAWIVGNARLEDILRGVEGELVKTREEVERVNRERKVFQERGRREMEGLERSWKEGVGRAVEVEAAVKMVEKEIRERLTVKSQK